MWAVAEVSWADGLGLPKHATATIEDMSVSGACLRVRAPIGVGSRVTVKWHREEFSAVTRNCRIDETDFLLGVRREAIGKETSPEPKSSEVTALRETSKGGNGNQHDLSTRGSLRCVPHSSPNPVSPSARALTEKRNSSADPAHCEISLAAASPVRTAETVADQSERLPRKEIRQTQDRPPGTQPRHERKVMQSKRLFPHFWRRQQGLDAPEQTTLREVPVNKPNMHAAEAASGRRNELLSYDDIYHAAGIMSSRSGYGIHKVVEMLNSERIRDLSKDVQRASVLMALESAGASVGELLQDATRRQQALNSYEDAQRKQLDEFESRKSQENAPIQAEMDRVTAHYAERIQRNRDLVAREKEALHNWQMAKQHESQRISDVIELCGKQASPGNSAMTAGAGAVASGSSALASPSFGDGSRRS